MATVQRASMIQYPDGQVAIHNIRKKRLSIPVFGPNETYSATLVNSWWDGTPMDDSKADGNVYFKLKKLPSGADSGLSQYIGSYFKVNLPNSGELFLEKDTMQEMRDLNSTEILLLQMGYYKGVRLNGYYTKGDTPGPIEYRLSDVTTSDDGGSVIEVGSIKLEHDFNGVINLRYYGCRNGSEYDNSDLINKAIESNNNSKIIIPIGETSISKTIVIGLDKQLIFEGEGRNSGNGVPLGYADGLSIITWRGLDPQYTSAIYCEDPTNTWCSFKNFHLNNRTDRVDVDGINIYKFIRGEASDLVVARFRNNFYIKNYCYYMAFYNCSFSYAKENNFLITEQPNHSAFNLCKFNNSDQYGVKLVNGQTGLTFNSCSFEQNKKAALSVENTQVTNLNSCYFEQNGTQGDKLTSVIEVKYYDNTLGVNTLINISGAYSYFRDGIDFVKVISAPAGTQFGDVIVKIESSEFTAKNFIQDINTVSANNLSALVRVSLAAGGSMSKIGVLLKGNGYIPAENGLGGILPIGGRPTDYKFFLSDGDSVTRAIRPQWDRSNTNLLRENLIPSNINFLGQNGDVDTIKFIDFPELSTASGYINYGRNTLTTGALMLRFYDNTTIKSSINVKTGQYTVENLKLGQAINSPTWGYGPNSPEGVISAGTGSLYSRTGFTGQNIYYKNTGTGNTGWVLLTPPSNATPTIKGLVNQATAVEDVTTPDATDEATAIALANANKVKINEMLAKFRDAGVINE